MTSHKVVPDAGTAQGISIQDALSQVGSPARPPRPRPLGADYAKPRGNVAGEPAADLLMQAAAQLRACSALHLGAQRDEMERQLEALERAFQEFQFGCECALILPSDDQADARLEAWVEFGQALSLLGLSAFVVGAWQLHDAEVRP